MSCPARTRSSTGRYSSATSTCSPSHVLPSLHALIHRSQLIGHLGVFPAPRLAVPHALIRRDVPKKAAHRSLLFGHLGVFPVPCLAVPPRPHPPGCPGQGRKPRSRSSVRLSGALLVIRSEAYRNRASPASWAGADRMATCSSSSASSCRLS